MKKICILILSSLTISSASMASVNCDCHLVYSLTNSYDINLPVTSVSGYFQLDASQRCEMEVKKVVSTWIIKPKVYTSSITNCVYTSPVVTD